MKLKKILTTAPDAAIKDYYSQQGDKWVLDVEGDDSANDNKIEEFRRNNIELSRKLAETEARQKKLEEVLAKLPTTNTPDAKPSTLEDKVTHLTSLFETSKKETEAARAAARQEQWRSSFLSATQKHKIRDDSASNALYAIASSTFKEKEGSFVPLDNKGSVIYAPNSTEPLSVDGWVEQQKTGPYKDLFSQPVGGGGRGSGGIAGSGAPRLAMTVAQAQKPSAEQFKAMQEGRVDIID